MKIKKGDTVKLLSGNSRNKTGEVLLVVPAKNKVIVKGVNIVKKHLKAKAQSVRGGIVDKALPISLSNVQLICPNCAKPTRVSYSLGEKNKARLCKKCKKSFK
ncbi:MAG TPA: 50S ribosomal protein L24 [bacterium]|jgi:large subunit ribosomal protein L24|nr:50S ribosomal protein L24 [bacterium]HOR57237.1 50S ribosomal protein L24 [bacterium]HPL55904.1 50S ribosomal protein L24 [bacterium]HPM27575.1 50S ribosomal protein L24 [bacterium]